MPLEESLTDLDRTYVSDGVAFKKDGVRIDGREIEDAIQKEDLILQGSLGFAFFSLSFLFNQRLCF